MPAQSDAAPPPEENPITLTLWPFWDVSIGPNGVSKPEPLSGVTVCVVKKRHYAQAWEQFVDTRGPCQEDVPAGNKVVLKGVPALSELVLTAEKDGFVPRAIPVTTGQWDEDMTGDTDIQQMHMFSKESAQTVFPGADFTKGQISVYVISVGVAVPDASTLPTFILFVPGGVSLALEPPVGDGPFYFYDGVVRDGATSTLPAAFPGSFAVFTNLPGNEYAVRLSENALANTAATTAHWAFGFRDERTNVIRAPVLPGHYTAVAFSGTSCKLYSDDSQTSCATSSSDGGAP